MRPLRSFCSTASDGSHPDLIILSEYAIIFSYSGNHENEKLSLQFSNFHADSAEFHPFFSLIRQENARVFGAIETFFPNSGYKGTE